MKTADLIPFILLELDDCDKYGFELTKNIETKSNGKIVIKQPTLYTLLKKLEKSKFITSYWEDSEIGGKRHYYKLTDNGRAQISTFPSYSELLKNALEEDFDDISMPEPIVSHTSSNSTNEKKISIMDELLNQQVQPIESPIPTSEIFEESNLDSATDVEINLSNTEILKDENKSLDEQFAENMNVSKFTEKQISAPSQEISQPIQSQHIDKLNTDFKISNDSIEIKHVDYENFKLSPSNQYARKVTTKKLVQTLVTSLCLCVLISLCELVTYFKGHSALYYVFFISAVLFAIFYPVIFAINKDKFRLSCKKNTYSPKIKLRVYIGLSLFLAVVVTSIIVSILLGKNNLPEILSFNNFSNIYAPSILFSIYFIDLLLNHLIVLKNKK